VGGETSRTFGVVRFLVQPASLFDLCLCLHCAPQLGKDDYDPEPDMQAVAVYRSFNSSCTFDQCYAMGSICRDELASDGKNETDQFCRRWCCALLVASGRSDLSAKATRLRAKDDVPMVIIGDGGCESLSDGVTDEWCTNTCKGGNPDGDVLSTCPADLCQCDGDDTEVVDYDPIERANEPDADAGDPATPTQPGQAPAPVAVPPAATVPGQAPAPTQIPAAGQAATAPAVAPALPDPSSMTGEAGKASLALSALGGLDAVNKACQMSITQPGNPHAWHSPG
jgi:hypothetical protein